MSWWFTPHDHSLVIVCVCSAAAAATAPDEPTHEAVEPLGWFVRVRVRGGSETDGDRARAWLIDVTCGLTVALVLTVTPVELELRARVCVCAPTADGGSANPFLSDDSPAPASADRVGVKEVVFFSHGRAPALPAVTDDDARPRASDTSVGDACEGDVAELCIGDGTPVPAPSVSFRSVSTTLFVFEVAPMIGERGGICKARRRDSI